MDMALPLNYYKKTTMGKQTGNNSDANGYHREEESDASKLAGKHLADPNHIITEEDMRKIKVGVTGEADAPTKQAVEEAEERIADHKADSEDDTIPGGEKMTPWDTIK